MRKESLRSSLEAHVKWSLDLSEAEDVAVAKEWIAVSKDAIGSDLKGDLFFRHVQENKKFNPQSTCLQKNQAKL